MTSLENPINNLHIHKVSGNIDDSFIGIKIKNDKIDFYYPEAYDISKTDNIKNFRKDVLTILNTIAIAKTLSEDKAKINTTLADTDSFALHSYLWVIKDYLTNGVYVNREKIMKENRNGKVNWKRTMKNLPAISKGNVIYTNLVVEIPNQSDNIIVEIHKYCIYKSLDFIGWLFGLSKNIIEKPIFNVQKKKLYLSVLNKELNNTFDDNKKLLFSHLIKIIKGVNSDAVDDEFVYGVDSYYYIFERMIDSVFGNVTDISKFNPKANWFLKKDNYKKTESSALRPDTILLDRKHRTAYILDSKYYRFGTTSLNNDLPETTSVQKQITYAEYIKKNHLGDTINKVRSAFILPYNKNNNKFGFTDDLEYIGYSKAEWKDNKEEHQIIYAFLMDLKHLITSWNDYSSHQNDIDTLISGIESEIEK